MRLKLVQNYNFNSHQDASDLRDNLGNVVLYLIAYLDSVAFTAMSVFKNQCVIDN